MFKTAQIQPVVYFTDERSYNEHRGDDAMVKKETDASQLSSERYEALKEEYGDTEIRVEMKFGKVTGLNVVTVYPILKKENNEAVRNDATEGMLALLSEHKRD